MTIQFLHKALFTFALLKLAYAGHTSSEWSTRTIYQVLTDRFARSDGSTSPCNNLGTYCGGTFKGIENNLDYIQGMGFDAIWISPVVENTANGYHGYWAKDLYKINSNFGTESDFKSLITALHARGMWIMLDVVGNHMGGSINDISGFNPFNQSSDYHDCNGCPSYCSIQDFTNQQQVQHCRLAGLPDLNQGNPIVAQALQQWVKFMVTTYDLDGIRVDTVPEVNKPFWGQFQAAAGTYAVGEVFNGDLNYVKGYQAPSIGNDGLTGILSYPMYFTLRDVFQNKKSMNEIQSQTQAYAGSLPHPGLMGTFLDNHDNPRFLNGQSDTALYKAGLAYVLFSDGIPIVYYGSEQYFSGGHDPACRETLWPYMNTQSDGYKYLAKLIGFRKKAGVAGQPQVQRYSDDTFYAFTRGDTFVALTNVGGGGAPQQRTITYHPYAAGTRLCNLFYPTTDCFTVGSNGFDVYLASGEVKVYSPLLGV